MKTRPISNRHGTPFPLLFLLLLTTLWLIPSAVSAQTKTRNPASMFYVTEVGGEALINTGDLIDDLTKRSVYAAQGTVIETKRSETGVDPGKNLTALVYSNGTGTAFDADTRVEMKRFVQEPFTPNRADADVEPSISQTQAFVSRGAVALCTSKLVAGSTMNYSTALGSVNIRGRKVVIEAGNDLTKISMLEGDSTVRAGAMDQGGITLRVGEQALIRRGATGQTNVVEIRPIPPNEFPSLDERVSIACLAKKTVYFEVRERFDATDGTALATTAQETAAGGSNENLAGSGDSATKFTPVNAFNGGASSKGGGIVREIVPVEILPTSLPVEFTVSAARITNPVR